MTARRFVLSALTLAIGFAAAAGLGWILLNVPESNLLALALSAIVVVLIALTIGVATGGAAAFAHDDAFGVVARRAMLALPSFLAGLALFALLGLAMGWADTWWAMHRGEIDAVFLRYFGVTRTAPLHTAASWTTWLVRWGLGLSVVVALTAHGTRGGLRSAGSGLRLSVRLVPLAAATAAVLIVSKAMWRLVFWRPGSLPATGVELAFAASKLGLLYLATTAIGVMVLWIHGRAAGSNRPKGSVP